MLLITGANGFIGINLVKELSKRKLNLRCFVHKNNKKNIDVLKKLNVEIAYGDILDKGSLIKAMKNVDKVIHLAAIVGSTEPSINYKINYLGTKNLAEVCINKKVKRFVYVSSLASVYKIETEYGKSKKRAEEFLMKTPLKVTILRPSLVYGKDGGLIFRQMVNYIKKFPVIPIIGSGKNKKQPVYIDDFISAIISVLNKNKTIGKAYNIGGPEPEPLNIFIDQICYFMRIKKMKLHLPSMFCIVSAKILEMFLRKKSPLTTESVIGFIQDSDIDISSAKKDLDYEPIPLKEGLKKALVL